MLRPYTIGVRKIRRAILSWYDNNRRDLPWRRRQGDPYAQWVAEIMLQQTRVETVIPYYTRFLERFPTVRHLAGASHDAVLKSWEGLGYYRRALHLHKAAKIVGGKAGEFPKSAEGWRNLPGVGEYTAAAIASIALGEPVAAVDGNVARVVSRLFAITADEREGQGLDLKARVREAAGGLICQKRPGDFNQAMMDLGSALCTPRSPLCGQCPARRHCEAFRTGRCASIPGATKKRPPRQVRIVAVAFLCDGRVLMRRRPRGGLWSGLWELPCREVARGESKAESIAAVADSVGKESREREIEGAGVGAGKRTRRRDRIRGRGSTAGAGIRAGRGVRVRHQLTHRSLVLSGYLCPLDREETGRNLSHGARARRTDLCWVDGRRLAELAVSTAHRKVLRALEVSGALQISGRRLLCPQPHAGHRA